MTKKVKDFIKDNGNIINICKECSEQKHSNFINNNGIVELTYAIENSKEVFIKAKFIDNEKIEHMWVEITKLIEENDSILIEGILDNEPILVTNVKYKDIVKVSFYDVSNFIADGKPFMDLI